MMNMNVISSLLACCLLLSSCTSLGHFVFNRMDTEYNSSNKDEIAAQNKAIVITKCTIDNNLCMISWKHIESGKTAETNMLPGNSDAFKSFRNRHNPEDFEILALEPGNYEFNSVQSNFHYYNHNGKRALLSFNVQPGEVVYLGALNFDTRNSNAVYKSIDIKDEYDYVRTKLPTYFPEIAPKLQKRLYVIDPMILALKQVNKKSGIIERTKRR